MKLMPTGFAISAMGMAIAGATSVVFLFGMVAIQTIPTLIDPCTWWNFDGRVEGRPQSPCAHPVRGISEGRLTFIIQSMGMPTVLLFLATLGIAGAAYSRPSSSLSVAAIFLFLTVPLMLGSFGVVTLIAAICFFISAVLTKRERDRKTRGIIDILIFLISTSIATRAIAKPSAFQQIPQIVWMGRVIFVGLITDVTSNGYQVEVRNARVNPLARKLSV
jgi:hypothetical protein